MAMRACSARVVICAAVMLLRLAPLAAAAAPAPAQPDPGMDRLRRLLDPPTLVVVDSVLADVAARGLPTAPVVSTALEGATRALPGSRIAEAVRAKGHALESARRALGPAASTDALVAGASALLAGASPAALDSLARLKRTESLVVPLVVLCDLLSRGVPRQQAELAVLGTAGSGRPDATLLRLRDRIVDDLGHGRPAALATQARLRELLGPGPGSAPARGGPP